jgi:hypothetical protein
MRSRLFRATDDGAVTPVATYPCPSTTPPDAVEQGSRSSLKKVASCWL